MKITVVSKPKDEFKTILFPIEKEDQLANVLSQLAENTNFPAEELINDFKADHGEVQVIYSQAGKLILLGLGKNPGFAEVFKAFRSFSFKWKEKLQSRLCLNLLYVNASSNAALWGEAAVNGLILGGYDAGHYKTDQKKLHPIEKTDAELVVLIKNSGKKIAEQIAKGRSFANTQKEIFHLVNAPGNKKLPGDLANWAIQSGKKHGFKVRVLNKKQISENELDALLAVNRGSEHPPVFIIMEYTPADSDSLPSVGLVGKGVTFDTGGLSIKPSGNMHFMKSDMGGAAAVFGAVEMAAKLKLPIRLTGIVPATDNCVGSKSVKPGDVINSYSGKSIEVIDTDAEGRLILADGLSYMVKNYKPDILIDLATLTGSAVRTLGYEAGAIFSNNDELAAKLYDISIQTGERVWRLPLWDAYRNEIKSDVADVKNFSGKPVAGAISAAKFLEFFTEKHPSWVHLDIAGVAFGDSEFTTQKSATGFGVRLLTEFIGQLVMSEK
ncbi:MAG: leucyl aminopeptidase family protein [Bacteroidetes bacterium]|nr:leucyl aminopeptidase family protein [Bacteroidota bacterium]